LFAPIYTRELFGSSCYSNLSTPTIVLSQVASSWGRVCAYICISELYRWYRGGIFGKAL
jgi:hypothetical protein